MFFGDVGSPRVINIPDVLTAMLTEEDSYGSSSQISAELGIITDAVDSPDFAVESRRAATFLTWPAANHKLSSEMMEHCLYYTGQPACKIKDQILASNNK